MRVERSIPAILALFLLTAGVFGTPSDNFSQYRITADDLKAVEEGIMLASKMAPDVFPRGVADIDVVLYDAAELFVFSRNRYELFSHGEWGGYHLYKVPHGHKVGENALYYCGKTPDFVFRTLKNVLPYNYFTCAPLAPFVGLQKKRDSPYSSRSSYLLTMIHEYAHAYQRRELSQFPELKPFIEKVKALKTNQSRDQILQEAFAAWCELHIARRTDPKYVQALKAHFAARDNDDLHRLGYQIAVDLDEMARIPEGKN